LTGAKGFLTRSSIRARTWANDNRFSKIENPSARGGTCGAITGAAMAVGRLAAQRIADHREAKRVARNITARLMDSFEAAYGHTNCRDLLNLDISTESGHASFIEGKIWHTICMDQITFALRELVALHDEQVWRDTVRQLGGEA
jgi:hypothetical protein